VVAKLASDLKKPDGLVVVEPDDVAEFMYSLPVDKLYGVGQKTSKLLRENGIVTLGKLAREHESKLESLVGPRTAAYLLNASRGIDDEAVTERSESIQISRMITLKRDTQSAAEILSQLAPVVEDVERRVIERTLFFRTVTVIGILPNLTIRSRSRTLDAPTNSRSALGAAVAELLDLLVSKVGNLRRVGVKVSDLTAATHQSSIAEFL
jgi:nucleotidyltransferase/DNA polymerase involved in DNA repair